MLMVDPRILLILLVLSGGYFVGEKAVEGIKKVDRAAVHGAKVAGSKIAHGFKKVVGK
jgi:hypothetical protein